MPPDTADDWDSPDDVDDAEQVDEEGDDASAIRATAKAKKEAGRLAGKLARIAVEHASEWILCEADHPLFTKIINTTKSDTLSLDIENLGLDKGVVRFRIVDVSV